jgi:hypothetical protein
MDKVETEKREANQANSVYSVLFRLFRSLSLLPNAIAPFWM